MLLCALLLGVLLQTISGTNFEAHRILYVNESGGIEVDEQGSFAFAELALVDASRPVEVIGGYSAETGLSTLLNTMVVLPEGKGRLTGFPVRNDRKKQPPPSIWFRRTPFKSSSGAEVVMVNCERCHSVGSAELRTKLFHIIYRLSSHLVIHSLPPQPYLCDRFSIYLRRSDEYLLGQKVSVEPGEAPRPQLPEWPTSTKVSWVWTAPSGTKKFFESACPKLAEGSDDLPEVTPWPLPSPAREKHTKLRLDYSEADVKDLQQSFTSSAKALMDHILSNMEHTRAHTAGTLEGFIKVQVQGLASYEGHIPRPLQEVLYEGFVEDRRRQAVSLFRESLEKVAEGDPSLMQLVLGSNAQNAMPLLTGSLKKCSELRPYAPPSARQMEIAKSQTWTLSKSYFAQGFSIAPDEAMALLETDLNKHLSDINRHHREKVLATVADITAAFKLQMKDDITAVPHLCDPRILIKKVAAWEANIKKLVGTVNGLWPSVMSEEELQHTLAALKGDHMKASNERLKEHVVTDSGGLLKAFEEVCNHHGVPTNPKALEGACSKSKAALLHGLKEKVQEATSEECRGDWMYRLGSFQEEHARMVEHADSWTARKVKENNEKLYDECKSSSGLDQHLQEGLRHIEEQDYPNDDEVDEAVEVTRKKIVTGIHKRWDGFKGEAISRCFKEVQEAFEEQVRLMKLRIEQRLYGSDEVREWKYQWMKNVQAKIEQDCTLCPFGTFFIQRYLESTAAETTPRAIKGKGLSEKARSLVVRKAVKENLPKYHDVATKWWVPYLIASMAIVSVCAMTLLRTQ